MKKLKKILGYGFLGILAIILITAIFFLIKWNRTSAANMELLGTEAPTLNANGYSYRDLNNE